MKAKPKIMSIVGARPQFIKLAPLAKTFSGRFHHVIVHTGQHYDDNMSQTFFRQLHLPRPGMNLSISGGRHGAMTGRMLAAIEKALLADRPDFVVVYGDTNSTLAGALAAAKLSIPVGQVEAGMRSFVDDMPEEINRRLTDHLACLHFCPTEVSMKNLLAEGIKNGLIHSGDLMYELLHDSKSIIRANQKPLRQFGLTRGEFLLITAHRAGNVDSPENLHRLVELLEALPIPTLFPVHPRTRKRFVQAKLQKRLRNQNNLILCEPLSYLDTLTVAMQARAVLTDSGGLQKEALFLGTPVLTLRDETEWVETLRRGNRLVGLDVGRVLRALRRKRAVRPMPYLIRRKRPSRIIADAVMRYLDGR